VSDSGNDTPGSGLRYLLGDTDTPSAVVAVVEDGADDWGDTPTEITPAQARQVLALLDRLGRASRSIRDTSEQCVTQARRIRGLVTDR